ncbi:hypothetical protein [Singulisphaera sp. PoT]|uniref:hypothetical protein n=1 Tax=Singulisphaera sp. PoT TaxID=3411797 RepID=UPI003BF52B61
MKILRKLRSNALLRKRRRSRITALKRPQTIPFAYLGKWIAWDSTGLKIVSVADTPTAAKHQAIDKGHERPILEWVPPAGEIRPVKAVENSTLA